MNRKILCWTSLILVLGILDAYESIPGRDGKRLYRVKVPVEWKREDPKYISSDTTTPLCEFFIHEENASIRISIHNFPTKTQEDRIPPQAQVHRWKRQFDRLDPLSIWVEPVSWGGFVGLHFTGTGIYQENVCTMIGWTMQLGQTHFFRLQHEPDCQNILADYTIKVLGPSDLVNEHKKAIDSFANSFELIEEIPAPL